ncbi:MAG: D-alanine--D-alanine ligase [Aquificae bacterium]|nr:D-alanine--D-alanine ligase [Aquificota bacterium]
MNSLKVALVYGGQSSEREISIKSGKAVKGALERLGIPFKEFDPVEPEKFIREILSYQPDVVFNALHGRIGEDGTIQGFFELAGFRYTGSPVKASAVAMDKALTKEIVKGLGVPTPRWTTVSVDQMPEWELFPAVVKPNSEGSSIGVFIVNSPAELEKALSEAFQYDKTVLVEEFIDGREITVGLINGQPLEPIEIVVGEGFYDYHNKYFSDKTRYIVSPQMEKSLKEKLFSYSSAVYDRLGCRGAARVDFMVKGDIPYFLEINTIPGLTDHSLLPKAAEHSGISFDQLIQKIIEGAFNGE